MGWIGRFLPGHAGPFMTPDAPAQPSASAALWVLYRIPPGTFDRRRGSRRTPLRPVPDLARVSSLRAEDGQLTVPLCGQPIQQPAHHAPPCERGLPAPGAGPKLTRLAGVRPNPAMHFFRRRLRALAPVLAATLLLALSWAQLADVHLHKVAGDPVHLHAGSAPDHPEHHGHHHDDGHVFQIQPGGAGVLMKHLSMADMVALPVMLLVLFLVAPVRRLLSARPGTRPPRPPSPHSTPPLRAPPPAV
jgi:hypothetical protein